jgi:hydrogenase 3 maturation protease
VLLHQKLTSPPSNPDRPRRVAVVGVGNELYGDDGAGVAIVQALKGRQLASEQLCLIEACQSPEAYTGVIRRFKPTHVLIVDCADMSAVPGTIDWLSWQSVDGMGASTHTFPLTLFATYLAAENGCEVLLLGIQPQDTLTGDGFSPAVNNAVQQITDGLYEVLHGLN